MIKKKLSLQLSWEKRLKLRVKGQKLWEEGKKLKAEGDRLKAEGDKLWIKAIGDISSEWPYRVAKGDYACILENGEVFEP